MQDPYLSQRMNRNRLLADLAQYGRLLIAFDFDNTVFDCHKLGYEFPELEEVLRKAKVLNHHLILFTCREDIELAEAINYCRERGYEPDSVNGSPIYPDNTKPYYNILLDDRAGLQSAYLDLLWILNEQLKLEV